MFEIAASLPGRLRLRSPALRAEEPQRRCAEALAGVDGVRGVRGNPRAGSIAIAYDPALLDEAAILRRLGLERRDPPPPPAARPRRAPSATGATNRWAKIGAMASLAVSLGALAVGRKRLHAIAGGIGVACIAVHMLRHRRRLAS